MQASLPGQHETLIFWQRNLATKLDQSFKHNFFELDCWPKSKDNNKQKKKDDKNSTKKEEENKQGGIEVVLLNVI